MIRIQNNAIHRADRNALGFIEVPHAFGAQVWIDYIDPFSLRNGPQRSFRITRITIDTFIGN